MKTCNNCGNHNPNNNKYCSECGSKLFEDAKGNKIICKKCGTRNNLRSNFCLNCGAELNKTQNPAIHNRTNAKMKRSKANNKRNLNTSSHKNFNNNQSAFHGKIKSFWIIPVVIILSIGIAGSFDLLFHNYNSNKLPNVEVQNITPSIKAQEYAVASKFQCSCGKCKDSLDVCDCEKAVEERNFIVNNLENGKSPKQIELAINKNYGGLISKPL
jgi:uncharacterized Zn finger protein (UPF0148 family)